MIAYVTLPGDHRLVQDKIRAIELLEQAKLDGRIDCYELYIEPSLGPTRHCLVLWRLPNGQLDGLCTVGKTYNTALEYASSWERLAVLALENRKHHHKDNGRPNHAEQSV